MLLLKHPKQKSPIFVVWFFSVLFFWCVRWETFLYRWIIVLSYVKTHSAVDYIIDELSCGIIYFICCFCFGFACQGSGGIGPSPLKTPSWQIIPSNALKLFVRWWCLPFFLSPFWSSIDLMSSRGRSALLVSGTCQGMLFASSFRHLRI